MSILVRRSFAAFGGSCAPGATASLQVAISYGLVPELIVAFRHPAPAIENYCSSSLGGSYDRHASSLVSRSQTLTQRGENCPYTSRSDVLGLHPDWGALSSTTVYISVRLIDNGR